MRNGNWLLLLTRRILAWLLTRQRRIRTGTSDQKSKLRDNLYPLW